MSVSTVYVKEVCSVNELLQMKLFVYVLCPKQTISLFQDE